jgi:hypothetical protein
MPEFELPTGLYWKGKRTEVERISLPFQTIETINESRAMDKRALCNRRKGISCHLG